MNPILANIIDQTSPKFNRKVVDGSASDVLSQVPEFLDDIFRSSMKSLSPSVDMTYIGYRRLTPREEFTKMIANENNKTIFDLAASDLYMVEYVFEHEGVQIKRHLYLPFTGPGNLIHISNTIYSIVPVLSDTVISPSYSEVFVRLLKDKLIFSSSTRNYIVNGEKQPGQVIHTKIVKVNRTQLTDNIGKPVTAISLYILGECGLREAMAKYAGTDKFIITNDNVDHLRDTYNVYESTKVKPRSLKEYGYKGHDLKILIDKTVTISPFLENFIFGIIYTLDILPEQAEDCVNVFNSHNLHDEKMFWRIILGRVVYQNSYSIDRIVSDMEEHFDTLQGYLDNLVKAKLKENNIRVETFFDLLAVIMDNYNVWLINSKEYNSDISNRYIDILYYILYDIIVGFNRVILSINKRVTKKKITANEIQKIFLNELSTRKIYGLVKSQAMNLSLMLSD